APRRPLHRPRVRGAGASRDDDRRRRDPARARPQGAALVGGDRRGAAGAGRRRADRTRRPGVAGAGPAAMPRATLLGRLGLSRAATDAARGRLVAARELVRAGAASLPAPVLARAGAAALAALDAFPAAEPLRDGMPREELRTRLPRALPPRFFDRAIDGLV